MKNTYQTSSKVNLLLTEEQAVQYRKLDKSLTLISKGEPSANEIIQTIREVIEDDTQPLPETSTTKKK